MVIDSTLAPPAAERRTVHRLAEGTELIGAYQGSGLQEPKYLVRRSDGQVMQLPQLLYRVAGSLDGARDDAQVARAVSHELGEDLGADQVTFLVEERLRPAGIVAPDSGPEQATGPSAPPVAPDLLLALRYRAGVVPAAMVWRIAGVFGFLFRRPVYVTALAAFVALDVAVLLQGDILGQLLAGLEALIHRPELTLLLIALSLLSGVLHECGHVAACRYGGARPGDMGVGLYIIWPALYSTVTDAYRLDRVGRLRTDLGGVYVNAVVMAATAALYLHTGEPWLLLALVMLHTETAWQFLPSIRLDGYYILADLVGVPDLFSYLPPVLKSLVPGRPAHPRVRALRPWSRRIIVLWVVSVIPTLLLCLVAFLLVMPTVLPLVWREFVDFLQVVDAAARDGRVVDTTLGVFQVFLLVLPYIGSILILGMLGGMLRRQAVARWGRGWFPAGTWAAVRRRLRTVALIGLGALVVLRVAEVASSHPATPAETRLVDGVLAALHGVDGPALGTGEWLAHAQLAGYAVLTGAFERHGTAVAGARELAVVASAVLVACLMILVLTGRLRPLAVGLPLTAALAMGPAVTALATVGPGILGVAEAALGAVLLTHARRRIAMALGALLVATGVATAPLLTLPLAIWCAGMLPETEFRPGRPAWWPAGAARGGRDERPLAERPRPDAGCGGRHRRPDPPPRGSAEAGRWLVGALMLPVGALGVVLAGGHDSLPLGEAEHAILLLVAAVVVIAALAVRSLRSPAAMSAALLACTALPWSGAGDALVLALVATAVLAALLTDALTRGPVEQRPHPLLRALVVVPAVLLVTVGALFQPVVAGPVPHADLAAWATGPTYPGGKLEVPQGLWGELVRDGVPADRLALAGRDTGASAAGWSVAVGDPSPNSHTVARFGTGPTALTVVQPAHVGARHRAADNE